MKIINLETLKTKLVVIKDSFTSVEGIKKFELSEIKETPYNRMIASAFWMASKLPVGGKIAAKVLKDSDLENKSKNFANKFFNPFYLVTKLTTIKK